MTLARQICVPDHRLHLAAFTNEASGKRLSLKCLNPSRRRIRAGVARTGPDPKKLAGVRARQLLGSTRKADEADAQDEIAVAVVGIVRCKVPYGTRPTGHKMDTTEPTED